MDFDSELNLKGMHWVNSTSAGIVESIWKLLLLVNQGRETIIKRYLGSKKWKNQRGLDFWSWLILFYFSDFESKLVVY